MFALGPRSNSPPTPTFAEPRAHSLDSRSPARDHGKGTGAEPFAGVVSSAAAVDDDEVGERTDQQPQGEHPEAELAVTESAHTGPHLADHVQDRAGREGVERELEWLRGDVVADDR